MSAPTATEKAVPEKAVTEKDLLRVLARAIRDGRVAVALDLGRLLHTDSPIAVQAEHTRWLYGVTAAAVVAGFAWGWRPGLAALAAGVVLYFTVGRPWIRRRMRARFFESVLDDPAAFKKLWRLRGVMLRVGDAVCDSPGGDWRRFVLDRLKAG